MQQTMASGSLLLGDIHRDVGRDHSAVDIASRKTQLSQNIEQLRALCQRVQVSESVVSKVERQWRALCNESSRFEGLLLEGPDQVHYSVPQTGAHKPMPVQPEAVFQPHDIDAHPEIVTLARSAADLQDEHDSAAADAQERRHLLGKSICQAHVHAPPAHPPRGVHRVQLALWRLFHSAAQTYQRQIAVKCMRVLSGTTSAGSTAGGEGYSRETGSVAGLNENEPVQYKQPSSDLWRDLAANILTLYEKSRSNALHNCRIQIGAQRVFTDIAKRFPQLGNNSSFTVSLLVDQVRNHLYDNFTRLIALDYMCSRRMNGIRVTYAGDYKRLCKEYRHNIFTFADAFITRQDNEYELRLSGAYLSHRKTQLSLEQRESIVSADNQDAVSADSEKNIGDKSDTAIRSIEVLIQEFDEQRKLLSNMLRTWKQLDLGDSYQAVLRARDDKDKSIEDVLARIPDRRPEAVSLRQLLIMTEAISEELHRSRLTQADALRSLARNVGDVCGIPDDQLYVEDTSEIWMELSEAVAHFKEILSNVEH